MARPQKRGGARSTALWLSGILLVAALVRIWALDFCLPSSVCRPDEAFNAGIGASIAAGDLNPHFFNYPTLYFYALGSLDGLLFSTGIVQPSVAESRNVPHLLLAGRWLSAVCGCLTVLATFFLGRRLGGTRTGLLASAVLAVTYLHVRDSHFMTVDVPVALLATLALVLALRAMDRGTLADFVAAGLAAGAATSTKYTAATLGVSLVVAYCYGSGGQPNGPRRLADRRLWFGLVAMAAGFLVASPFVVLDFGTFADQFRHELAHFRGGFYPGERDIGSAGYYLTRILPHGFGVVPLLLALVAVACWIRRRDRRGIVLLSFLAAYGISVGAGTTVFARYVIPLMPALAVATAVGVERVSELLPRKRSTAMAAMIVVSLAQPVWNTIRFNRLLGTEDSRRQAAKWIDRRLESGGILQIGGFDDHHWVLGPLDLPRFRILNRGFETQVRMIGLENSQLIDRGVRYVLTHDHPLLYSTLQPGVAEWLQDRAERLICFDPFIGDAADAAVYDYEDAFYLPFARFARVLRPGPAICVYDLGGTEASGEK